jgi:hypothetical protein
MCAYLLFPGLVLPNFLQLMVRVHAPTYGTLDPGIIIGCERRGFRRVPLVASPRPPTDYGAHLMPAEVSD